MEVRFLRQLHALVARADRGGAGVKVELVVDRILKAQPDAALFWVYKSALRMAARDWKEALAAARLMEPLLSYLYTGKLRRDLVGHALLVLLETDQIEPGLKVVSAYKDRPDMNDVFQYNAACVMCRTGKLKETRAFLKKALDQDTGWVRNHMRTDPDLQDLRDADPGLLS